MDGWSPGAPRRWSRWRACPVRKLSANLDQSCRKAVWMTASAAAAPLRRLSRSSRSPRCAWAPAASSDFAPASIASIQVRMACADEFFHDGGTDKSGSSCNKYTHMWLPDLIPVRIDQGLLVWNKTETSSEYIDNRRQPPVAEVLDRKRTVRRPRENREQTRAKSSAHSGSRQGSLYPTRRQCEPGRNCEAGRCWNGTLYRHFPTRDELIEAGYRNEVEKLAAAAARFAETMSPLEALRAWMLLLVDYIAAKHIIAPALNTIAGGPSKLHEGSRTMIHAAIDGLVKRARRAAICEEIWMHTTCFER